MTTFQESVRSLISNARKSGVKLLWLPLLVAGMLIPFEARGQLGLDPCCAIISAGLSSISDLLKGVVAKPLSSIQQIQQQVLSFEQQVVFPASAINAARALAVQTQTQLRQIGQIYRTSINSATLPASQALEQSLLSHNPNQIGQVGLNYSALYGGVMAPADAYPAMRDLVDMSDAEAQAALKKAVEIDALADVEIQAADQINQQLTNATPGTAPILQAQAAAWLVRANAYSQSAMAELVRVRSVELANASAQVKFSASDTTTLRTNTGQALQR
jgi:hypothetical protein